MTNTIKMSCKNTFLPGRRILLIKIIHTKFMNIKNFTFITHTKSKILILHIKSTVMDVKHNSKFKFRYLLMTLKTCCKLFYSGIKIPFFGSKLLVYLTYLILVKRMKISIQYNVIKCIALHSYFQCLEIAISPIRNNITKYFNTR